MKTVTFDSLREFIEKVEELGERRVVEGADWNLEIGNITEVGAEIGVRPLLLFDKIKEYPAGYRVATNMYITPQRTALAMGFPSQVSGLELVKVWRDKLKEGIKLTPPIEVETGPIKENIHVGDEVDLFEFPTPKWHELDGGRYIGTGDLVIMRDPDEGWVNAATYRTQIHDKNTATIMIRTGGHGDVIRKKYWAKGLNCPAVVTCGQEPVLWASANISVGWGTSEYDYAGGLKNKPIEVIKGVTTDLPIPATAEIALEGEIVPPEIETRVEGPFGEWAGYYAGGPWSQPAFKVKSILHRNDPILQGNPPSRFSTRWALGYDIRKAAAVWAHLDNNIPGVKGVWVIEDSSTSGILVISIEQQHLGHAEQAALLAAGCVACAYAQRLVMVVDDDIDPSNISEVLWALGTRTDPEKSFQTIKCWWSGVTDPMIHIERKLKGDFERSLGIIIACKPYHWIKDFPRSIKTKPEVLERTRKKWEKFLI